MKKWIFLPIIFFFFLLSLPSLLSTSFGKNFLCDIASKKLGTDVKAGSLSLSWIGPQSALALEVRRAEFDLRAEELYSPSSLITLLFFPSESSFSLVNPSPSSFRITPSLFASFVKSDWSLHGETEGRLDFSEFSFTGEKKFTALGKLHLSGGEFRKAGAPPLLLKTADFEFSPKGTDFAFEGKIRATCEGKESQINLQGEVNGSLHATANWKGIPIALLSQSLSYLIGPSASGNLSLDLREGQGLLLISGETEQLTLPKSRFAVAEGTARLTEKVALSLKPNLDSWSALLGPIENIAPFLLHISELSLGEETSLVASTIIPAIHMGKMNTSAIHAKVEARSLDEILATFEGENLSLSTTFRYDAPTNALLSLSPAVFSYDITNRLFHELLAPFGKNAKLLYPTPFTGKVHRFSIPLSKPATSFFEGRVEMGDLEVESQFSQMRATFSSPTADFSYDGKKEKESLLFETKALEEGKNGGTISVALSGEGSKKEWYVEIDRLSSSFLSTFFGIEQPLEAVIGSHLDLSFSRKISPSSDTLHTSLSSEQCNLKGFLEKRGEILSLIKGKPPLSFKLELTPEGFNFLKELHPKSLASYALDETATFSFNCNSLSLPLNNWEKAAFQGKGTIENFAIEELQEKKNARLSFAQFSAEKLSREPLFKAELLGTTSAAKRTKSTLLPGDVRAFFAIGPSTFSLTAKAEKFPSLIIDSIARLGGNIPLPLFLLFGEEIDLDLSLQLQERSGPIDLRLKAQKAESSLHGLVSNGILSLKEPFSAKVEITPELSSFFLRDLTGKIESVQSTSPLYLSVPATGAFLPIAPFSIEKAKIPALQLDLGKLLVRNGGNLSVTLGLLKLSQFSRGKLLSLWFTPMGMELADGILYIDRTDILVDGQYQIAFWGAIDLVNDQVEMKLGLPKETLTKAFAVQGLPNEYMLQIPVYGTLGKVEIDSKIATAKIAALILWSNRALAKKGGNTFGGLVEALAPLPDARSAAPSARRPFPWD